MSVYRVTGQRTYREHRPGETFETLLSADVEERAVKHRFIEVLERSIPTIRPGSETVPEGWLNSTKEG